MTKVKENAAKQQKILCVEIIVTLILTLMISYGLLGDLWD